MPGIFIAVDKYTGQLWEPELFRPSIYPTYLKIAMLFAVSYWLPAVHLI